MTQETATKEHSVFICYGSNDLDTALRLYDDLRQTDVTPWIDKKDLLPGQKRRLTIKLAIEASRYVIVLLSQCALAQRGSFHKELRQALGIIEELPPDEIFVIPVRIDDCESLEEGLQARHYVDLFPSYEDGLQQILRVLRPGLEPPTAAVPPSKPEPESSQPSTGRNSHSQGDYFEHTNGNVYTGPVYHGPVNIYQQDNSEKHSDFELRERRIDAAIPRETPPHQAVDLYVQVRLPNSPLLGLEAWPPRRRPSSIEQDSDAFEIKFPRDPETGALRSTAVIVQVSTTDFRIAGDEQRILEIPPEKESKKIAFLLTPQKQGVCRVNIDIYRADDKHYLGQVPWDTDVTAASTEPLPQVGYLVLSVQVGSPSDHANDKFTIKMDNSSVGVIGDNTTVHGGIHIHKGNRVIHKVGRDYVEHVEGDFLQR